MRAIVVSASAYPPSTTYPPVPSLPLGVAILAILVGLVGFLFVLGGILLFALGAAGALNQLTALELFGIGGGLIALVVGLILLGVALGLWHQRLWALVLSILVVGLLMASRFLSNSFFTWGGIILVVLLVYLVAVHRHFD